MTSQDRNTASSAFYILAAHGGAGFHSPTSDSSLKCSLREAISTALTTFSDATTASGTSSESSALDTATALIAALEDAPDFNAGYGSNLTFDGDVECDASLMSTEEEENSHSTAGTGATSGAASSARRTPSLSSSSSSSSSYLFGSVGAVHGVRNPVLLARRVLDGRRRRRQPGPGEEEMRRMTMMGRVPPLMLVGEGALQFAREQGLRVVDRSEEEGMVSPRARREWQVWRERWDRCCRSEGGGETPILGRNDAVRRDVAVGTSLGSPSDPDLGGGHEDEEESESMLTPRAGSEDADGGDGGFADVETLRARQDTVGAVVLVGGEDDVHQQVAAGVSRCVVCSQVSFSSFFFISVSSIPPSCIFLLFCYHARSNFLLLPRSFTAVVCYSSTLDALARSVGQVRHRLAQIYTRPRAHLDA